MLRKRAWSNIDLGAETPQLNFYSDLFKLLLNFSGKDENNLFRRRPGRRSWYLSAPTLSVLLLSCISTEEGFSALRLKVVKIDVAIWVATVASHCAGLSFIGYAKTALKR
jgi:hypothetical protein